MSRTSQRRSIAALHFTRRAKTACRKIQTDKIARLENAGLENDDKQQEKIENMWRELDNVHQSNTLLQQQKYNSNIKDQTNIDNR